MPVSNQRRKPLRRKSAHRPARQQPSRPLVVATLKTVLGVSALAVLVVAAAMAARHWFPVRVPAPMPDVARKPEFRPQSINPTPKPPDRPTSVRFEILPPENNPPDTPWQSTPRTSARPQVAIVIDDLGHDLSTARQFIRLNAPLTVAILPHSPRQRQIARAAQKRGLEVMLHLPMEPKEYPAVDPGPGTLLTTMPPNELVRQLESNLSAIPGVKGVNSHMGSQLTTVSSQMYQIFSILKKRGLYFVDSRTTKHSICRPSARLLQVPFAERDVFLDHDASKTAVRRQLLRLIHIAERYGAAVAIAHPYPVTVETLAEELPRLQQAADVVPVSALVKKIDTASRAATKKPVVF